MNKILAFTAALLFTFAAYAQDGVKWEKGTLQEALEKAKNNENGINRVFLDCYTSWCGHVNSCQKMFLQQKRPVIISTADL